MDLHDSTQGVTGFVVLVLRGPDGKVKETRTANTVTTFCKNSLADQFLAAPTLTKPTHMAVGTGTPSGTALGVEVSPRVANTSKNRSTNVVTIVADFAAGVGTGALTEAGTFDQLATGGNMFMSASFAVVNKLAADTLQITWTLTVN